MKNIKKCNKIYTSFLCIFLAISAVSCASAITQIPKSDRMNSGLNISASVVNEADPYVGISQVDYLVVKISNDGNSKVKTDVVCERNGHEKKTTVVVEPYTIREVYFGFANDNFHLETNCRLENTEFLGWYPLM
jgi:hypothetical protein